MNTNKICFSSKLVTITAEVSFDDMGALQELLQLGAMEAADKGEAEKTTSIIALADNFGIDIDIEITGTEAEVAGNDPLADEDYLPDASKSE